MINDFNSGGVTKNGRLVFDGQITESTYEKYFPSSFVPLGK